ncbi:MAG TPA: hypothetical protein VEL74_07560 [Thermoanaerobaculia bacterium]|nr:hypothetical protein [Thermoanaerobaculia bacterium]
MDTMSPTGRPMMSEAPSREVPPRETLVERTRELLVRDGLPRLQMSGILVLTGAAGFFTSFLLLEFGLDSMAVRYPTAVLAAYGVFLLLLRLWLRLQERGWENVAEALDLTQAVVDGAELVGRGVRGAGDFVGGGGRFGGGGASASFEAPTSPERVPLRASVPRGGGSKGGSSSGFSLGLDLDEGGIFFLVAILLMAVAALGAAFWVVWSAPVLLAEVLVDGLIMAGLYRRLRKPQPGHWLAGAVRRTCVPALVVALLFFFAGWLLQRAAPDARSIGGAWKTIQADQTDGPR